MKPCKDKGCLDYKYHKLFCNCECEFGKKMTDLQWRKYCYNRRDNYLKKRGYKIINIPMEIKPN